MLPGPEETSPPFRQKNSATRRKIPLPIFGSKFGSKTRFLVKFFTTNHVMFRKIVELILKYVKKLLIYLPNSKNIVTLLM